MGPVGRKAREWEKHGNCPTCGGTGRSSRNPYYGEICPTCNGAGYVKPKGEAFDSVINTYLESNEIILAEVTTAGPKFNPKLVYTVLDPTKFELAINGAISTLAAKPQKRKALKDLQDTEKKFHYLDFNGVAKRFVSTAGGNPVVEADKFYDFITGPTTSGGLGLLPLIASQMPKTTPGVAKSPTGPVPIGGSKDKNAGVNSAAAAIQQAHKDILTTIDKSQPTIATR